MSFSLNVDAETWRSRIKADYQALTRSDQRGNPHVGLIPSIESHAWGLSRELLAREAAVLGASTLAVTTADDALAAMPHFDGEILVTEPWDPRHSHSEDVWGQLDDSLVPRVIRTIANTDALHRLASQATSCVPVVLQGLTSRHCIGLQEPDLDALLADDTIRTALRDGRIDIRGVSLNLPAKQPRSPQVTTLGDSRGDALSAKATNRVRETWGWTVLWIRALAAVEQSGIDLHESATTMWINRLDDAEVAELAEALEVVPLQILRGSELWLAQADALQACGTVLAVHRVERGRDVGDRQRRTPKDGYIVTLRGGTSHGVSVLPASSTTTLRQRATAAAGHAMETIGRLRSPFEWAGKRRRFAEPPGAGTSLVWLSAEDVSEALAAGYRTPAVGDEWLCAVHPDVARYDRIVGLD